MDQQPLSQSENDADTHQQSPTNLNSTRQQSQSPTTADIIATPQHPVTTMPSREHHTPHNLPMQTPPLRPLRLQHFHGSARQPPSISTSNTGVANTSTVAGSTVQKQYSVNVQHPEVTDDDEDDHRVVESDPTGRFERYSHCLGKGAYKEVFKAFDQEEGVEVAWNQLRLDHLSKKDAQRVLFEIQLLEGLRNDNIINLFYSWVAQTPNGSDGIYFITELMTSGTLKSYSKKTKGQIKPKILRNWAKQILSGLVYLHTRDPPIIHRDLKSENIFINGNNGQAKIGDLGLAAVKRREHLSSVLGTPEFMAPELYDEKYDERVDVYAFGMVLLEIVTKEYPYSECSNQAQIYRKVSTGIKPAALAKVTDDETRKFIAICIESNPVLRPMAADLLLHPFITSDLGMSTSALDNGPSDTNVSRVGSDSTFAPATIPNVQSITDSSFALSDRRTLSPASDNMRSSVGQSASPISTTCSMTFTRTTAAPASPNVVWEPSPVSSTSGVATASNGAAFTNTTVSGSSNGSSGSYSSNALGLCGIYSHSTTLKLSNDSDSSGECGSATQSTQKILPDVFTTEELATTPFSVLQTPQQSLQQYSQQQQQLQQQLKLSYQQPPQTTLSRICSVDIIDFADDDIINIKMAYRSLATADTSDIKFPFHLGEDTVTDVVAEMVREELIGAADEQEARRRIEEVVRSVLRGQRVGGFLSTGMFGTVLSPKSGTLGLNTDTVLDTPAPLSHQTSSATITALSVQRERHATATSTTSAHTTASTNSSDVSATPVITLSVAKSNSDSSTCMQESIKPEPVTDCIDFITTPTPASSIYTTRSMDQSSALKTAYTTVTSSIDANGFIVSAHDWPAPVPITPTHPSTSALTQFTHTSLISTVPASVSMASLVNPVLTTTSGCTVSSTLSDSRSSQTSPIIRTPYNESRTTLGENSGLYIPTQTMFQTISTSHSPSIFPTTDVKDTLSEASNLTLPPWGDRAGISTSASQSPAHTCSASVSLTTFAQPGTLASQNVSTASSVASSNAMSILTDSTTASVPASLTIHLPNQTVGRTTSPICLSANASTGKIEDRLRQLQELNLIDFRNKLGGNTNLLATGSGQPASVAYLASHAATLHQQQSLPSGLSINAIRTASASYDSSFFKNTVHLSQLNLPCTANTQAHNINTGIGCSVSSAERSELPSVASAFPPPPVSARTHAVGFDGLQRPVITMGRMAAASDLSGIATTTANGNIISSSTPSSVPNNESAFFTTPPASAELDPCVAIAEFSKLVDIEMDTRINMTELSRSPPLAPINGGVIASNSCINLRL
ncbi:hypothetical protein BDV3_000582 [Batrachochytrium dendrobatidis]|uniref:non-specific serine/threonine protein kinase n=2 Tax=Batrachochytrium dendrobatidis TaxID=109871 RepID=A0A177WBX6_BATDL|nr:hypothetical protein BDEG_21610 [Batrachochytrium dendrobatidis JEL423]